MDIKITHLINKLEKLSNNYHRMSLLFYELKESITLEAKQGKRYNELKEILNKFNFDKISDLTKLTLKDLKNEI